VTYVQSLDSDELRIILCLQFDPHAPPLEKEALKQTILNSPQTIHAVETTGDYHFMFEVAAPDLAWFNDWVTDLAAPFAALVAKHCTSFVCRRFIRRPNDDRALWVPSKGTLKRIHCSQVDKVEADGDYVKIHSQGQAWHLHSTMHAIHDFLGSRNFVQLHRSIVVRAGFIDCLERKGRHWLAHLKDGTCESVAQSHAREVLETTHSPNREQASSNGRQPIDA
jgi:hypothetical protein